MKLNKILFFSTCISLALILIRVKLTHQITYMFLIWNLFLASIPYLISRYIILDTNIQQSKIAVVISLCIWLLFLPNAPYIITDYLHLNHMPKNLFWFDTVLISAFAISGMLFCIYSLSDVYSCIKKLWNNKIAIYTIIITSFLSGFGVYLGRYLRFNTWDVITNPNQLLTSIIESLFISKTWLITLSFGWLLSVLFLFTKKRLSVR